MNGWACRLKSSARFWSRWFEASLITCLNILTREMEVGWQTFTQIASQFEPVDRARVQPLFERARRAGLLRSGFVPTIQFMLLVPWCQIYPGYLPLYQRLVPNEDLTSVPRLEDARDYLVDFLVAGMMNCLPETKPEKEN